MTAASVGEDGPRIIGAPTTPADLAPFAQIELAAREKTYPGEVKAGKRDPDLAGRSIAAWRTLVALLKDGGAPIEPCLGASASAAWAEIAAHVEAAAEMRLDSALRAGEDTRAARTRQAMALRQIRGLVIRAAIRAGADLAKPSLDSRAAA